MTPANITALQSLVQADPALAQQLQSAATNEAATQLLAKAASQKGLAVDAHAIADYLKASPTARITDAELEAVAGGVGANTTKPSNSQDVRFSSKLDTDGRGMKACAPPPQRALERRDI